MKPLADALSRRLAIVAEDAQRHLMLPRAGLDLLQRFEKGGLSAIAAGWKAQMRVQIIRTHKGHINAWHGQNIIQILEPFGAFNLHGYQKLLIGLRTIALPVSHTEPIGAKHPADAARTQRRIF